MSIEKVAVVGVGTMGCGSIQMAKTGRGFYRYDD